jgi:hypothetical protein
MRSNRAWLGLLLLFVGLAGAVARPAAAQDDWWDPAWPYRHPIAVDANGFARTDKPVEARLNFTPLLAEQGGSGAFDPDSLRVIEVDGGGAVINDTVPFQFDKAGDYNATNKARGVLTFLMQGDTAASETRHYHVYFDVAAADHPPASFPAQVTLSEAAHKGYPSLRIQTAGAEYFYHKPGGGFATLLDADDNDWVNWNTAAGGAGDYRGIPNMVHPNDGGFFHPGRNSVTTTLVGQGPLKASFKSVSSNNAWVVQWDVFPGYARMTVLKAPAVNYWFLYEGPIGGQLQPATDRITRSDGDSVPASGALTTDIPGDEWVFVTDPGVGRSLYLAHHQEDSKIDGYYADADKMAVFGFGRSANQRFLNGLPRQFTFGFVDATAINGVRPAVNGAFKPLAVAGANDDGGGGDPACDSQPYSVYFSPKGNSSLNGISLANEDVARYNAATCQVDKVFDGSVVGLPAAANVDALALKDGDVYLSLQAPYKVPGIPGVVDDSDVIKYNGAAFSLFYDGSLYGLTVNSENVDAIAFDETGALLLSTTGNYSVTGLPAGADEDLLRFDGAAHSLYFDGSHNAGLTAEDIAGASVAPGGDIYLSLLDGFNLGGVGAPGVRGNGLDVIKCVPASLGAGATSCAYSLFWDAGLAGLPAFDAIDVALNP